MHSVRPGRLLATGADKVTQVVPQRTIRLVRGHLVVSGMRDRPMAAMQAVKDQHAAGPLTSDGDWDDHRRCTLAWATCLIRICTGTCAL